MDAKFEGDDDSVKTSDQRLDLLQRNQQNKVILQLKNVNKTG